VPHDVTGADLDRRMHKRLWQQVYMNYRRGIQCSVAADHHVLSEHVPPHYHGQKKRAELSKRKLIWLSDFHSDGKLCPFITLNFEKRHVVLATLQICKPILRKNCRVLRHRLCNQYWAETTF